METSSFARQKPAPVAKTKKKGKNKSKSKRIIAKEKPVQATTLEDLEQNYVDQLKKGNVGLDSNSDSSSNSELSDTDDDYFPICASENEQDHDMEHGYHDEHQHSNSDSNDLFNMEDIIRSNAGVTEELFRIQGQSLEIFQQPYVFQNNPDLISNHFMRLSEQIKATFNLSTALITALSCVFSQNLTLQQQNVALNTKLTEALTRLNFIRMQNAKATQNSTQILNRQIDLAEKIHLQNQAQQKFQQQIQFQASSLQEATASIRLNIKHPPSKPFAQALKSGLVPSQVISAVSENPNLTIASTLATPSIIHNNNSSSTSRKASETNFTLKVKTIADFQSSDDFLNKHLRAFQIQHQLPKICSISTEKESHKDFRLRFENHSHRQIWHDFLNTVPELIQSTQILNLNSTKIRIKGIPTVLANKDTLTKILCNHFKLQTFELIQIFQFEEKKSSGYSIAVFAVSPAARRLFHANGDSFYIDSHEFAISIEDFLQPLQCSKCHELGHPAKRCSKNKTCSNCCKHSCQTEPCPNQHFCINCGQNDHSPTQRDCCPAFSHVFTLALNNLDNILKEKRQDTVMPPIQASDALNAPEDIS
jgi:hypothetical protein